MKDLKFLTISIRNFFSYGNVESTVNLSVPGCVLITGQNLDDVSNGIGANGTGKSTILRAMLYLFADSIPDDMLIGDIVNNINNKDCVVGGTLLVDGIKYTIRKYRQSTEKPEKNYVEIFKGDDYEHNLAKGTLAEVNKQISDIIGIIPEMFKRIVMFDVNAIPFFKEKGAVQRGIMEELMNLDVLTHKAEQLSELVKQTKQAITTEESDIRVAQVKYDNHQNQIVRCKQKIDDWQRDHDRSIYDLQRRLDEIRLIDVVKLQETLILNAEIEKTINDTVNEIKLRKTDLDALLSRKASIEDLGSNYRSMIQQLCRTIARLQTTLSSNNEDIVKLNGNFCPECNQQVSTTHSLEKINQLQDQNSKLNVELIDTEQRIVKLTSDLGTNNESLSQINEQIASLQNSLLPLSKKIVELNGRKLPQKTQAEIDNIKHDQLKIETQLNLLISQSNPHQDELAVLVSTSVEAPNLVKVTELTTKLNHQQFLYKLMTDKKSFVRKYLIDRRLYTLNTQLHYYLQQLGLPHTVLFNNDLSATIAKMGRTLCYGGLSGGQKARVDFAVCLAFRDLLQISSQNIPFLMVDEVLDHGLDDVGVQLGSSVINKIAKDQNCSIFLITHKSEIVNRFPQRIVVQFKDGFSQLLSQED